MASITQSEIRVANPKWDDSEIALACSSRAKCDYCPHFLEDPINGQILVKSRGNTNPRVLVVDEAPGPEENRKGFSFIGPSARHGESLLIRAGIPLEEILFTSIVKCYPHKPDRSSRSPTEQEVSSCIGYLLDEIERYSPEVIITLGNISTKYLTGIYSSSITSMSGKFYRIPIRGKEYLIVPSVHPSADLHSRGRFESSILRSGSLAWGLINQVEVPVQTEILNSNWSAEGYLKGLIDKYRRGEIEEVAFDLEYDTSVSDKRSESNRLGNLDLFDPEKKLVAASFATDSSSGVSIPLHHFESKVDVDKVAPLLRQVLTELPIVVHGFLKAEGPWTREKLGVVPNMHRDTMLMSYALHMSTRGHGLKPLAQDFLGWGNWSIPGDAWFNEQPPERRSYKYMPIDMMGRYSAIDPVATKALKDVFESKIEEEGLWPSYQRRHDLAFTLLDIEERGALVDMEMLSRLRKEYPKIADSSLLRLKGFDEVSSLYGDKFNPRSSVQLVDVLFNKFGAPVLSMNPALRRGEKPANIKIPQGLKAGSTSIPYSVSISTPNAWLGSLSGEKGSEKIELLQDGSTDYINLKKPLKYDHSAPVYLNPGSPSASDSVVVKMLNDPSVKDNKSLYEFLSELRLYKKVKKLSNDYFEVIPKNIVPGTNRLTINYLAHVTETGRLAARNMNIHSFPASSDVRRLFVSRWQDSGGLVSQMDQSQLEMRVLAALTNDQHFIDVYYSCPKCSYIGSSEDNGVCPKCLVTLGGDLHSMTASQIFNKDPDNVTKDERRYAKTISFGIVYGASAFLIADQTGLTVQEADQMIRRFMKRFDRVASWIEDQHKNFEVRGWAKSPLGTKLYFEHFDSDKRSERERGKRQSQNYIVQSAAAEMVIDSLTLVNNEMKSMHSHPWETTHDSIVFDLHPDEIMKALKLGKSCMEERILSIHDWMNVPLIADVNLGVRWDGDLVVKSFDDSILHVKGNSAYYNETLAALRKNYTVKEEIVDRYKEEVSDTVTTKSGYVGKSASDVGVEAVWYI
ncbi:MAG: DNA polymerase [Flavobacteriaceae bacterium]